jgi:S-DNA-T family DNA segregation ATPase FtsK/SpoIIIE
MAKAAAGRKARARASFFGVGFADARVAREAAGVLLAALVALAAVALWSFDPSDALFEAHVQNAAGSAGATLGGLLVQLAGAAAWGIVLALGIVAAQLVSGGRLSIPRRLWVALGVSFAAVAALASLLPTLAPARFAGLSGGWLGGALAGGESALVSAYGAFVLNALLLAVGIAGFFGVPAGEALAALARGGVAASHVAGRAAIAFGGWSRRAAETTLAAAQHAFTQLQVWRERRARRERVAETREELASVVPEAAPEPARIAGEEAAPREAAEPAAAAPAGARPRGAAPAIVDHARERKREPEQEAFTFAENTSLGPYEPPDVAEIFQAPPENARRYDRESLIMNSRILEKKLADFGVMGRVVTVHPGPVITMYEFEPAPGVKVNRITNLSDDLALALRALSIRIIAPIPGKSVVGIEVPNGER